MIAKELAPGNSLHHLLSRPGIWFLLASRPMSQEGEIFEWNYCLNGGSEEEVQKQRQEILTAADNWKVFCPQRRIDGRDQWLGIALKNAPDLPKRVKHRVDA